MNIEKVKNAKTKIIGKKIEYYKTIESTSVYAKQIAEDSKNNGKIIIAEMQTNGIGTKGSSWYTGIDNIAMTIILNPNCKVLELEGLTLEMASIIKESIQELYNVELKIKKPNDLLLNNKKISGILTQTTVIGQKVKYVLIGIGFNVNEINFNKDTKDIATSLKREYKDNNKNEIIFSREDIIIKIIEKLEKYLNQKEIEL